jgi:hypothetical protein
VIPGKIAHGAQAGLAAALLSLAILPACTERRKGPASVIEMSDPSTVGQLTEGFYGLEGNKWRWTAGQFSVFLQPPPGADDKGGYLQLAFFIPGDQLAKIGPMKLTASVEDLDLEGQTITQGGFLTYSRAVPAEALKSNLVRVYFSFDKSYLPGNGDARSLGAVVSKVSLRSM